jgi:hypothetical protein
MLNEKTNCEITAFDLSTVIPTKEGSATPIEATSVAKVGYVEPACRQAGVVG